MSTPPWRPGSTPVSIDRCAGSVQEDVLTASSKSTPARASASKRGVVGRAGAGVAARGAPPVGVRGDPSGRGPWNARRRHPAPAGTTSAAATAAATPAARTTCVPRRTIRRLYRPCNEVPHARVQPVMRTVDTPPAGPQNVRVRTQEESMRSVRVAAAAAATAWMGVAAYAQTSHTPRSPRPDASGSPLQAASPAPATAAHVTVPGYVLTFEVHATAPGLETSPSAAPEARVLTSRLKGTSSLVSRVWLAQDLSRQEVLSNDFILPAGTLVMHKAGDKFYVIADPKAAPYVVMDSQALLEALEGSGGVINTQYEARVQHTDERKTIAGVPCRKSVVVGTYVSSIPPENDRGSVQQQNT